MKATEFDNWYDDLCTRFPSVDAWLGKVATSPEAKRRTLRTWCVAMDDVMLADAVEVNTRMQCGDAELFGKYEHDPEKIPQHVRRLAKKLAWDRDGTPEPQEHVRPTRETDFPAGKILRRWAELERNGTPRDEARRIALEEFPVGKPRWEPRYHCLICRDSGFVTVASPAAMEAVLAGTFEKCHHREGAMRCSCKGHLAADPKRPLCVYDPAQDFIITDFLWREEETQRFVDWVNFKREEFWNSKRDSSFDQFNQREFAS